MRTTRPLAERSISAVLWGTSGSALHLTIQFGIQITMARLIGPEQYGLFALAYVVVTLGNYLSSVGIAYGLIQKSVVTDQDVRFANFWQLLLGGTSSIMVFVFADALASFFREPAVAPVIRAIAIICVLDAMAAPSLNLLRRDLDFKAIHLIQIATYTVGYGLIGVPLAMAGFGAQALVAAFVSQTAGSALLLYWRSRHVVGFTIWHSDAPSMMRYGLTVFLTNLGNWALMNLSRVIVGRVFTSTAVGHFALAFNFATQFATPQMGVLQSALFASSSRVQNDLARLRTAFLTMIGAVALFIAPIFVGIGVASETIVLALYGAPWRESASLLQPLALAMPLYVMFGMATPMLWTSGRIRHEFLLQLPVIFVLAGMTWWASGHSIEAVAWVLFAIFAMRMLVVTVATCKALHLSLADLAAACSAGGVVTLMVAAAIGLADAITAPILDNRQMVLGVNICCGLMTQLVALRLVRPWLPHEVIELFRRLAARVPPSFSGLTSYILPLTKRP